MGIRDSYKRLKQQRLLDIVTDKQGIRDSYKRLKHFGENYPVDFEIVLEIAISD